jgi:hypothetical protein
MSQDIYDDDKLKSLPAKEIIKLAQSSNHYYSSDNIGPNAQQAADLANENNILLKAILLKMEKI